MDSEQQGFWSIAAVILGQFALQVYHIFDDKKRNDDVRKLKAALSRLQTKIRKQK